MVKLELCGPQLCYLGVVFLAGYNKPRRAFPGGFSHRGAQERVVHQHGSGRVHGDLSFGAIQNDGFTVVNGGFIV